MNILNLKKDDFAIDPVCGLRVETGSGCLKTEEGGSEYHFCSEKCWKTFMSNPLRFSGSGTLPGKDWWSGYLDSLDDLTGGGPFGNGGGLS